MKNLLFKTHAGYEGLILRLTLAIVMFPHGAQKLLGWFGGFGFENTMSAFTGYFKLPYALGVLVILIEFFGSLFLVAGFATRFWALSFIGLAIGMMITSTAQFGFFMNWMGTQSGEGIEFHLLLIGICTASILVGSGSFSIDKKIELTVASRGR